MIRILNAELFTNGHVLACTCVTGGDDLVEDFVLERVLQSLNEDAVRSTGREADQRGTGGRAGKLQLRPNRKFNKQFIIMCNFFFLTKNTHRMHHEVPPKS